MVGSSPRGAMLLAGHPVWSGFVVWDDGVAGSNPALPIRKHYPYSTGNRGMSYLRMGQEGTYVDIPGGSKYYLYGNGDDIGGWTYEEFAGAVLHEIEDLIEDDEYREDILGAFRSEFGGIDRTYDGGIAPPERGEIFCQVVDSRSDDVELRDDLHERIQAEMTPKYSECPMCGDDVRSDYRLTDTPLCGEEECEDRKWAEAFEIDYEDYVSIKDLPRDEFRRRLEELQE